MQELTKEIVLSSMPKGKGFRDKDIVQLIAIITAETANISNEYMEQVLIPELFYLSDKWNPQSVLYVWEMLFGIDELILDQNASDELRNIVLRVLIDLMKARPYPISLTKIQEIFAKYEDIGLFINFDKTFTFGVSRFGYYDSSKFGLSSGTAVITIDSSKKFSAYYAVFIRMLKRVLPIWVKITTRIPFVPTNLPSYDGWLVLHDCNTKNYWADNGSYKNLPKGNWSLGTLVNTFEDNYFVVKPNVLIDMLYFRNKITENYVHFSFFAKNIDATNVYVRAIFYDSEFGASEIKWTFNNISLLTWTFCSVKITMPNEILVEDLISLEIFCDESKSFELDQIRMFGNKDGHNSYEIYLTQEIGQQLPSSVQTNNAIAIYLNGFDDALEAQAMQGYSLSFMQELLNLYEKFGLQAFANDDSFSFDTKNKAFGAMRFTPYIVLKQVNTNAEYANIVNTAIELIRQRCHVIYEK